MKIIEKIEIKHFRSFDGSVGQPKVEICSLKDLNIFSGANDSGKSNILRALNLFFNNEISPGGKTVPEGFLRLAIRDFMDAWKLFSNLDTDGKSKYDFLL